MSPALVSVVIPAFNARGTLGDALDSVYAQSYAPIDVIVVDDGSTDGTGQWVAENYPAVTVERVANGGPSRARNRGIERAEGEWIAFLDADDRWHPDKIRRQMDVVKTHPDVALVATDWSRGAGWGPMPAEVPVSLVSYRDLLVLNRFQTSTVIMRRDLARELGGFDAGVDGAEDWDLWLRAARRAPVAKIDWPAVMYRDVETGYSKDVWRVYQTMQLMLAKHRDAGTVAAGWFRRVETWHHLRFAVAFLLMHDRARAWAALARALRRPLVGQTVPATVQFLIPFLWKRVRRSRS